MAAHGVCTAMMNRETVKASTSNQQIVCAVCSECFFVSIFLFFSSLSLHCGWCSVTCHSAICVYAWAHWSVCELLRLLRSSRFCEWSRAVGGNGIHRFHSIHSGHSFLSTIVILFVRPLNGGAGEQRLLARPLFGQFTDAKMREYWICAMGNLWNLFRIRIVGVWVLSVCVFGLPRVATAALIIIVSDLFIFFSLSTGNYGWQAGVHAVPTILLHNFYWRTTLCHAHTHNWTLKSSSSSSLCKCVVII